MTPWQKLLKQEGTARRTGSMQQSSAAPSLHLWFLGVAEDCCMLPVLLAVPSCFNSFWHGVIPTSYFIFNHFYTCIIKIVTKIKPQETGKICHHYIVPKVLQPIKLVRLGTSVWSQSCLIIDPVTPPSIVPITYVLLMAG